MPVATAALVGGAEPQEAVWLPLARAQGRMRLAELADVAKPPETLERIGRGHRGWLYKARRERPWASARGEGAASGPLVP